MAPRLERLSAQLYVADIGAACAFYGRLGFMTVFTHGDPAFYGQVRRDSVRLDLRVVCEPVFVGDIREREVLLAASIALAGGPDLRELFAGFEAAGVPFFQPIRLEPWGALTFIVQDPDGNLLLFASPAG
jgi:catechol 2,3-dioxygenase-like lactoylglutathione lyase family enzyme